MISPERSCLAFWIRIPFMFITPQSSLCCEDRLVFLKDNRAPGPWKLVFFLTERLKIGPITILDLQIWKQRTKAANLLSFKPIYTGKFWYRAVLRTHSLFWNQWDLCKLCTSWDGTCIGKLEILSQRPVRISVLVVVCDFILLPIVQIFPGSYSLHSFLHRG